MKTHTPNVFGERRVVEASEWDQVLRQFGLHDLLLDQLVKGVETRVSSVLGVIFSPCVVVLEGCDLSLELLVELLQLFLLMEDVLRFERHLFSLTIGLLLLFLHFLFHLVQNLKEMVFLWLRQLEAERRLLR